MKKKSIFLSVFFVIFFAMMILFSGKSYAGNTTVDALRSKFPAGKFWNHYAGAGHGYYNFEDQGSCNNPDGWTDSECLFHDGTTAGWGQPDCNSFNGGQECAGFARKLFYDYYGEYATNRPWHRDINAIKPGDVVRYEGDGALPGGHEVWVIGVDSEKLIVAECNWYKKCEISWDRWVKKNNITVTDVYSAPYAINDNQGDTEKPTINEIAIDPTKVTDDTIQVKVKASDNVGVTKVKFRIWRSYSHSDSGTAKWGTYNSSTGYWEVTFNESDIKVMNDNLCRVDAWASDAAGNESEGAYIYDFVFGSRVSGLGDFVARIVPKKNTNYCIGTSGDNNDDDLKLRRKNQTDKSQLWKFEEISTGIYKITNLKNGRSIDVEGGTYADYDDCNMQLWDYAGASQQQFLIQNFNGGYRIVPTNTKALRAIDFADAIAEDGRRILLYKAGNLEAQTWTFEKCAESVKLDKTTMSFVGTGSTQKLTATITPSTVANKTLTWSSSNTSVAKVSSTGVVTPVGIGTATITVKTTDGTNKSATCKVTVNEAFYTDVKTTDWYYSAVKYCKDKGIILGTTETTYNPNTKLTRGMLVTILHRMEGKPEPKTQNKFKDVYKALYYYDAVVWATEKGIVHGYGNGSTFGPDDAITREDLAVILRNYAQYKGKNVNVATDLGANFSDGTKVSTHAKTAMQWAVGTGVITGNDTTSGKKTLTPQGTATRAEAASMIYKYCTKVK